MSQTIKIIGIVGAGTMGHGIAQVAAQAGYQVLLNDIDPDKLDKQLGRIAKGYDKLISKEKITEADKTTFLERIQKASDLSAFKSCDLIIEAITENVTDKLQLMEQLNQIASDKAIIATNTSSISVTLLASRYKNSAQVVGMHFFNPVPLMRLVEVIGAIQTSEETISSIMNLSEALGKTPAKVNDRAGFAVNRILIPMLNEAIYALYEGVTDAETIDTTMKLGANHPMGPLSLADFVGLDVLLGALEVMQNDLSPERYRPCPLLRKLVEAGHLGRKTGKGFFTYEPR